MLTAYFRDEGRTGGGRNKKLLAWAEWAEEYQPTCPGCRVMYAERTPPDKPPCETCSVDMENNNHEAAMIYQIISRQVITAGNEIIDLNYGTLIEIMRLYRVKDMRGCFEKVIRLFHQRLDKKRQGD